MQIFIRVFTGKTFTLEVKSSDTIRSVKAKIREVENIPMKQQRLVFRERQLQDDTKTLADYDVQDRATINFMLCLCGC